MTAPLKLAGFLSLVALAMGGGLGLGPALGPLGDKGDSRPPVTTTHVQHAELT